MRFCFYLMFLVAFAFANAGTVFAEQKRISTSTVYEKCTTKECCNTQGSVCLGICAGLNSDSPEYGMCITTCDVRRKQCMRKASRVVLQDPQLTVPGIEVKK